MTYSPWVDGRLVSHLRQQGVQTLVITGGETDVCVLATVLGAIDFGFHVIVLSDAVCSGADETHDAAVDLLGDRFSVQLKLLETDAFLCSISQQK
jgi:nicotinamidase-related amidase